MLSQTTLTLAQKAVKRALASFCAMTAGHPSSKVNLRSSNLSAECPDSTHERCPSGQLPTLLRTLRHPHLPLQAGSANPLLLAGPGSWGPGVQTDWAQIKGDITCRVCFAAPHHKLKSAHQRFSVLANNVSLVHPLACASNLLCLAFCAAAMSWRAIVVKLSFLLYVSAYLYTMAHQNTVVQIGCRSVSYSSAALLRAAAM